MADKIEGFSLFLCKNCNPLPSLLPLLKSITTFFPETPSKNGDPVSSSFLKIW